MKFVRAPGVKSGERQNDKIHDLFDRGAKEQAAHQRVLRHKNAAYGLPRNKQLPLSKR
jgi:hypothetical protein